MNTNKFTIPSSGTTSLGASFDSASFLVERMSGFALQAIWSDGSSPVGTLKLQASNDDSNWEDITGATFSVSGNSGHSMINVAEVFYTYVRAVYTRSSGSGNLLFRIQNKGAV